MLSFLTRCGLLVVSFTTVNFALAQESAFKIKGKTKSVSELQKENQGAFFKVEEEKYQLIEQMAYNQYLEYFWQELAKKSGKSVDATRKEYLEKNAKVTESEIKAALAQFKDHPELAKLSAKDQRERIVEFLKDRKERSVTEEIISNGVAKKELEILYPKPQEPRYNVAVIPADHVRYGANSDDIKPQGCSNDCPITVVEYSEFQCPFCARVLPATKRLLTEYKGKVRWIVRDFPLNFHARAKPAAVAAHCAGKQGKYWHMYAALFDNQTKLGDDDFVKYAKDIKNLDQKKWAACVKSPNEINKLIDDHLKSGMEFGVSGTPAFFINGRRLSGALPFEEFKRIFDEELAAKKKG